MGRYFKPVMVLTGYKVQYVDMRDEKPRDIHTEVYVLDSVTLAAVMRTGQNVLDFIKARYERGGYNAFSVEKMPSREAVLDLQALWESAR